MNSADYFKENKYCIIKNFLHEDVQKLTYQYCLTRVQQKDFKFTFANTLYDNHWDGFWGDNQAPNGSYSMYGDVLMDSILQLIAPKMNEITGVELVPTYSYWRFYEKGEELKNHVDRESCEISTTLSIGKNYSNLKEEYNWPIWIKDKDNRNIPIILEDGDMLVYRGCELDHWREPLKGNHHAQVFLHFNDKNGPYNIIRDGRPNYGLPATFARKD